MSSSYHHAHVVFLFLLLALIVPQRILSADVNSDIIKNCSLCAATSASTNSYNNTVSSNNNNTVSTTAAAAAATATAAITNPSAIITNIGETCQSLYDEGALTLSDSNCTRLQQLGTAICGCHPVVDSASTTTHTTSSSSTATTTTTDNSTITRPRICTLCRDGNRLPQPLLEVIPGSTCAELQIDAIFDLGDSNITTMMSGDEEQRCLYHQDIVGTYCGCHPSSSSTTTTSTIDDNDHGICRLCGSLLPRPGRIVNGSSCLQHEFRASVGLSDNTTTTNRCTLHYQAMHYADECCVDDVPSAAPSDSVTIITMSSPGAGTPSSLPAPISSSIPKTYGSIIVSMASLLLVVALVWDLTVSY